MSSAVLHTLREWVEMSEKVEDDSFSDRGKIKINLLKFKLNGSQSVRRA